MKTNEGIKERRLGDKGEERKRYEDQSKGGKGERDLRQTCFELWDVRMRFRSLGCSSA